MDYSYSALNVLHYKVKIRECNGAPVEDRITAEKLKTYPNVQKY